MIPHFGTHPIGLDIGHNSVKMLQLDVADQNLTVRCAAQQRLEGEAVGSDGSARGEQAMNAALKVAADLLKRNKFAGRSVIAALPRQIVHVKNVRLPLMPTNELAAAVRFEARNIFNFDAEQAHVDFIVAGEVRQGGEARQEVIVLAARRSDVDDFVERLDRVGLIVASLDAEPCALYRAIERFVRRRDDEQDVNVILDVGLRRTQVIIGRGRELSFFKTIDIGGQRLNEAVAQRLGIGIHEARALRLRMEESESAKTTPDGKGTQDTVHQAVSHATRGLLEELGREIALCLRYYSVTFRGPGPGKVRVVGGEAHDPNLRGVLGVSLSIPVEAAQPLYSINCPPNLPWGEANGPHSHWATALGLALKQIPGKFPARDGRPRLTRPAVGEVVDLNREVATASESSNSKTSEVNRA